MATPRVGQSIVTAAVIGTPNTRVGQSIVTIAVLPIAPLLLACNNPPSGAVNVPYSQALSASNGTAPYTFALNSGALPTGLSLNASTGVISGNPTTAGTYSFVVKVTDAAGATALASCSISITQSQRTQPQGGAGGYPTNRECCPPPEPPPTCIDDSRSPSRTRLALLQSVLRRRR